MFKLTCVLLAYILTLMSKFNHKQQFDFMEKIRLSGHQITNHIIPDNKPSDPRLLKTDRKTNNGSLGRA